MKNLHLGWLLMLLVFCGQALSAQEKKRLSHDDYAAWNRLGGSGISAGGDWLQFAISPQHEGDPLLHYHQVDTGTEYQVPRGSHASFSPGNRYAVFHIRPGREVLRQARAEGLRRNQWPTDSIGIMLFDNEEIEKLPGVVSYALPKEPSDWMAYLIDYERVRRGEEWQRRLEKAEQEQQEREQEQQEREQEKQETEGERGGEEIPVGEPGQAERPAPLTEEGRGEEEPGQGDDEPEEEELPRNRKLYIYNPFSGERFVMEDVKEYVVSDDGSLFAAITEVEENDSLSLWQVHVFQPATGQSQIIDSREGEEMRRLVAHKEGSYLAWMFTADTADIKLYDVYLWNARRNRVSLAAGKDTQGMPEGSAPSIHRALSFSDNGERLFLGTAPIPEPEPEDTLLPSEKHSVDVWHWQDPQIQPQQLNRVGQERNRSFLAAYHIRRDRLVPLTCEDMTGIVLGRGRNAEIAVGSSSRGYEMETTWTGAARRDVFLVDVRSGERKMILEGIIAQVLLSPGGHFVYWYDRVEKQWFAYDIRRESITSLTRGIPVPVYNELDDTPAPPSPHGIAGWTKDDASVLIYDRYDVWNIDPRGRRPAFNLTGGYGREHGIRMRYVRLDADEEYIDLSRPLIMDAFSEESMRSGYYALEGAELKRLILLDASLGQLTKAADAERFIWRRSSFKEFPDLWVSDTDFGNARRITLANPQMEEYYWGSVELVEWRNLDNEPLRGLLYLPEDLDPEKKYPLIVYFYERSSQALHRHRMPSPSASVINIPYCTSNGYIVFVPDIIYTEGFPGESAYKAIVSGTQAMLERYPFIDGDRMGLQGQSWGGYQIAYIITRTNMFRAAMAGAPVSNMISAYGGIRWESGRSRQFQYELTQSRIGGTLWEKPFHYIENSPVFFADKIETPLLIMHNDNDGAVPWYQGIELFMALRRLESPVWMLVYNDEGHNLSRWPSRMDLSVRLYQFFDHYLKDAPPPVWLKYGIPAVDKGKVDGYELVED